MARRRDALAHDRDDADADAGQRDDVAAGRDDAAQARDSIADGRDVDGGQRDADAELRDADALIRDRSGNRRDDASGTRDLAAVHRDELAARRDDAADRRDRDADRRDRATGSTRGTEQAASDRRRSAADRVAAAAERIVSAMDRSTALADRVAGATRRDSSEVDRDTALTDRSTALADRVAGATRRDSSEVDRDTALDDRAASAVDRRSAREYAALELRMAESEARAWRLLQALPDPVVVADAHGIIELINVQAVALFGYQPHELVGQPVERLIPTRLHEAHRSHRAAYVAAEQPTRMSTGPHIVAVRKDGTTVPVEVNLSAITLSTGRAVLASIRDVSDRRLADAELRISDERFRVSFDRAPIGMALIDLHPATAGRLLQVNDAMCTLTGYDQAQLLATSSPAITHPEDRDETVAAIARLVDGHATRWNTDKRYVTASGRHVWVHFSVSVVHDADDFPSYGVSQVEDITGRKHAEAQMAERFHELATNVDVGFLVHQLDPPASLYTNPAYLTVLGLDPHGSAPALAGARRMLDLDGVDRLATLVAGAASGCRVEQEWQFRRPDGVSRWVSARVSPIVDEDGQVRRIVGLFEDVSDRRAAEVAVTAARAEAERANEAKNEFLSRMSHELRTPLNAVLGFAQLLELDALSSQQEDAVGHILRGGRHLLTMIDDILDITGIEADRMELSVEPVEVVPLVEQTLGLMAPLADVAQVRVRLDDATPSTGLHVRADHRRLKQVLINLLSNAIKYNVTGGSVDVRVSSGGDGELRIAVVDTGRGIPAAVLPRLFSPFDRLGRQADNIDGTGIGLVLARRLTTLMGGRIEVDTTEGLGSTFTVVLPASPPPHAVETAPGAPSTTSTAAAESTLVYIEDNRSNVELMTSILCRRAHWTMAHASTVSAGLELVRSLRPDVVLLDLHLPDGDGAAVLRALKADPATRSVPVGILSADASPTQAVRLLDDGAAVYLTKPLDVAEVCAFLDAHTHVE